MNKLQTNAVNQQKKKNWREIVLKSRTLDIVIENLIYRSNDI